MNSAYFTSSYQQTLLFSNLLDLRKSEKAEIGKVVENGKEGRKAERKAERESLNNSSSDYGRPLQLRAG